MVESSDDYDFEWICPFCDYELKVKVDMDGKCVNCNKEYTWDFDCEYDDAVYIPIFKSY